MINLDSETPLQIEGKIIHVTREPDEDNDPDYPGETILTKISAGKPNTLINGQQIYYLIYNGKTNVIKEILQLLLEVIRSNLIKGVDTQLKFNNCIIHITKKIDDPLATRLSAGKPLGEIAGKKAFYLIYRGSLADIMDIIEISLKAINAIVEV